MKVLIAAGGTGGHLFPARQLGNMLKVDCDVLFAGHLLAKTPFFERKEFCFVDIASQPLGWKFFRAVWKGFWQSIRLLRWFSPDVVVGFGSYHTFPLLLAAAVLRKKLVLFEANCTFGKVNRLMCFAATRIACQFPISFLKKEVLVPLLPWTSGVMQSISHQEARQAFGLHPDRTTILIFGGSQGAAFLNQIAPPAIAAFKNEMQVLHFTGLNAEPVHQAYVERQVTACVKAFENNMALAYAAATVAFCRSGAGTVAELIRFQVPSLLIPYPYATEDHQRKNGDYLACRLNAARLLLQKDATCKRVQSEIRILLTGIEERKRALMQANQEGKARTPLADVVRGIINSS